MNWFSQLKRLLEWSGGHRTVSKRKHHDDFVQLFIDRLEDRRVLNVSAVLVDGVLSITGTDGADDVTIELLNAGNDDSGIDEEFIRILDNGMEVEITGAGLTGGTTQLATSALTRLDGSAGGLVVNLGEDADHLNLQIPTGASFDNGALSVTVEESMGDDTLTLIDNGSRTLADNVILQGHSEIILLGDSTFELDGVDVSLEGTLQLTTNQVLTTNGDFSLDGMVTGAGYSLTVDIGAHDFSVSNGIGFETSQLDSLAISAESIGLEGAVFTSGNQSFSGDLSLNDDLELIAGGDVELHSVSGGSHSLEIQSGGTVHFDGDAVDLLSIRVDAQDSISLHDVTTAGDQSYVSSLVLTNSDYVTNGGSFAITGDWDVQSDTLIDTDGGVIDLRDAVLYSTNPLTRLSLDSGHAVDPLLDGEIFLGAAHIPATASTGQLLGSMVIENAGDVSFSGAEFRIGGDFQQLSGSGTTTFDGAVTVAALDVSTKSISVLPTAIMTTTGSVFLQAGESIEIGSQLSTIEAPSAADITIQAATVTLTASLFTNADLNVTSSTAPVHVAGNVQLDVSAGSGSINVTGDVAGDGTVGSQLTLNGPATITGAILGGSGSQIDALIIQGGQTSAADINVLGTLTVAENASVLTTDGGVTVGGKATLGGDVTTAPGKIIDFQQGVELTHSATLQAGMINVTGDIVKSAGAPAGPKVNVIMDGTSTVSGMIGSGVDDLTIRSGTLMAGDVVLAGDLVVGAGSSVSSVKAIDVAGSATLGGDLTAANDQTIRIGAGIDLTHSATLQAGMINVTGDIVKSAGAPAGPKVNVIMDGTSTVSGMIGSGVDDLTIRSGTLMADDVVLAGDLVVGAGSGVSSVKAIDVAGSATLGGDLAAANDQTIRIGAGIDLTHSATLQAGTINVTGDIVKSAGAPDGPKVNVIMDGTSTVSGMIGSGVDDLTIRSGTLMAGDVVLAGDLVVGAGSGVSSVKAIDVAGSATLGGDLAAANDQTIRIGAGIDLTHSATLQAGTINVAGDIVKSAGAPAGPKVNVILDGTSTVSGTIGTGIDDLTIRAGKLTGGGIDIEGGLTVEANLVDPMQSGVETTTTGITVDGDLVAAAVIHSAAAIDIGGVSSIGADVSSTLGQSFGGMMTLTGNVSLEASDASAMIQLGQVQGDQFDLTVTTAGQTLLQGDISDVHTLVLNGGGETVLDAASIAASHSVEIADGLVVAQNTSITAADLVVIEGAVESQSGELNTLHIESLGGSLTPDAGGVVQLLGDAGAVHALGGTSFAATTEVSIHDVTTEGSQHYSSTLVSTHSDYLTGGGDFTIAGVWDVTSDSSVVTAGGGILLGAATLTSSNVDVSLLLDATDGVNPGGTVVLNVADATQGNLLGDVQILADMVTFQSSSFEVQSLSVEAADTISMMGITTHGEQTYQADRIEIEGQYLTGGGAFSIAGNATPAVVVQTGSVVVTTDDGANSVDSKIDLSDAELSAEVTGTSLTLDAGSGADILILGAGNAGDTGEHLDSLIVQDAKSVQLGSNDITVTGTVEVQDLEMATTSVMVSGALVAGAFIVSGNVQASSTITTTTGGVSVSGNLSSTEKISSKVSVEVTGTSELGADVVAEETISLQGDVTLTSDVSLTAESINVMGSIGGDAVSQHALHLEGESFVSGSIGGGTATLGDVTVTGGNLDVGSVNITGSLNAAENLDTGTISASHLVVQGDLTASADVMTTVGEIEVGGNLDYETTLTAATHITVSGQVDAGGDLTAQNGGIVLGTDGTDRLLMTGDVTISATDNVSILGDVVGSHGLTLDVANGTSISGSVGLPLEQVAGLSVIDGTLNAASINVSGDFFTSQFVEVIDSIKIGGASQLGGDVTSGGDQTYQGAVTFFADMTFTAADGVNADGVALLFESTLDEAVSGGTSNVSISTDDDVHFLDAVGNSQALDSLTILMADDVDFSSTLALAGDFLQSDGTGLTRLNGTSGSGIAGSLNLSTSEVEFAGGIDIVSGQVEITADEAISFTGTGGLNAGAESIELSVDADLSGDESFTQSEGSVIQTTGDVTISVMGAGDLLISDVRAGASAGLVTLTTGGAILDNSASAETANVTAASAELRAGLGIGAAGGVDDLNTDVDTIAFVNDSGLLHIQNSGALTLDQVGTITISQALGGGTLTASSPLTIGGDFEADGDFSFIAGDSVNAGDDLTIDANVTHLSGNGFIAFIAGDNIVHQSGTIQNLESGGSVNEVRFLADHEGTTFDDGDRGGISQSSAGAIIAGNVSFVSFESVELNQSTGNDIGTVAASLGGAGASFSLVNQSALTIGTVTTAEDTPASLAGITTLDGAVQLDVVGLLTVGTGAGEGVDAGAGTVEIQSAGLTELAASTISAAGLLLQGTGDFVLAESNLVDVLAVSIDGELEFTNNQSLLIGSVDGIHGVTTTGDHVQIQVTGSGNTLQIGNDDAGQGISTSGGDLTLLVTGGVTIGDGTHGQSIDVGAGTILIDAAGVTEQSGSTISADGLELRGAGTFELTESNSISTLAAAILGDLFFQNSGALVIGVVDGPDGVVGNGSVGITTGNGTIAGGEVSITADGVLTVDEAISTSSGSGGFLMVDSAVINNALNAAGGNITLVGGGDDLVINFAQQTTTSAEYTARRDVIVNASISTTGLDAGLTIRGDRDADGSGGVHILASGLLDATGEVLVEGSDLFATASDVDAVRVDSDGLNNQILAGGDLTLQSGSNAPAMSDVVIAGALQSTAGSVFVAANRVIQLESTIIADTGTVELQQAVQLTGETSIDAAGGIDFQGTVDGTSSQSESLTLTAAAGNIQFQQGVGQTVVLGDIIIQEVNDLTFSSEVHALSLTQNNGNGTTELQGPVQIFGADGISLITDAVTILNTVETLNGGGVTITNASLLTIDAAGDMTLAGAFVQNGMGAVETAGDITTTGDEISFTSAVSLTGDVLLDTGSGAGDVIFESDVSGDSLLTIAAGTGEVRFQATVGGVTALSGLTVLSSGSVEFADAVAVDDQGLTLTASGDLTFLGNVTSTNGGTVSLSHTGTLTIDSNADFDLAGEFNQIGPGNVLLGADLTTADENVTFSGSVELTDDVLISAGTGDVLFESTLDDDGQSGSSSFLKITSSGTTRFNDTVGGNERLMELVVDGGGSLEVEQDLLVSGDLSVDDDLLLTASVMFSSSAGSVLLNGSVNSESLEENELTVSAVNQILFAGAVGQESNGALGSLILNDAASTSLQQDVRLVGDLSIDSGLLGEVNLDGNIVTTGTGSVFITNDGTLTIGNSSTLNLQGSFIQDGAGDVMLGGDITTASGDVRFDQSVTLTDDVSIDTGTGSGNVTFNSDLSGPFVTTITAGTGDVQFQTIGDANRVGGLSVDSSSQITLLGDVKTVEGGDIQLTHSGLLTLDPAISLDLGGSFVEQGGGTVSTGADIKTTNDEVTFHSAVTLTDDVLIDTGTGLGAVSFLNALDATSVRQEGLTISAGAGDVLFEGSVGSTELEFLTIQSVNNLTANSTVNVGTLTQLAGTGTSTFNAAVTTTQGSGVQLAGTNFTFGDDTGDDRLTVNGSGSVSINNSGLIDIAANADFFIDGSFTQTGGGHVETAGDINTVGGEINFADAVVLTDSGLVTFDTTGSGTVATGAAITFQSTLDGESDCDEALTLNAGSNGDVLFNDVVGGMEPLGAVVIESARDVTIEEAFHALSLLQSAGTGVTTTNGDLTIKGVDGVDLTTEFVVINGEVDVASAGLGAVVSVDAVTDVEVNGTILSDSGQVTLTAGNDIDITGEIVSETGAVELFADQNIRFSSTGAIRSEHGTVAVIADADNDNDGTGGVLSMADGSLIDAGDATVALFADGDVSLSSVQTTNDTAGAVVIVSKSAGVVDNGDSLTDIVADSVDAVVTIQAVSGIGFGNALETEVYAVDVVNSTSGGIELTEATDLVILQASEMSGGDVSIETIDGSVEITDDGINTVADGAILVAANGDDVELIVDAAVSTEDGGLTLTSDGNQSGTTNGSLITVNGNIFVEADADLDGSGAVDFSLTPIQSSTGTIDVIAAEMINLLSAETGSSADDAVVLQSRDGAIEANVTADAGQLNLEAETGISINSTVDRVVAVNATAGDIVIDEMTALDVIGIDQQGPGGVEVSADGTLTLLASGTGISATSGAVNLHARLAGSDLLVENDITTTGGRVDLQAGHAVQLALGTTVSTLGDGSDSGDVSILAETGAVMVLGDVKTSSNGVQNAGSILIEATGSADVVVSGNLHAIGVAGTDAGDVTLSAADGSIEVASIDVSAGGTAGTISLTAADDIVLNDQLNAQGTMATTSVDGAVTLVAGNAILDGNDGSTLILTGDLSLSAGNRIGEISDFVARTGNAIDAEVRGVLQDLTIENAGGEIHLNVQGDLQAATGAIVVADGAAATLLLQTSGDLDAGSNPDVFVISEGDQIGLHAGDVLTLPDAGLDVGTGTNGGTLRLSGGVDVVDPAGRELGALVAQDLFLTSNAAGGDTTLNVDVTNLDVDLSGSPAGTMLTVDNVGEMNIDQILTNAGDVVVNNGSALSITEITTLGGDVRINNALTSAGDISIDLIDAGTGDVILDTTANGGQIRDLNADATNIIATGLAMRIQNATGVDVVDQTIEVQVETLAASAGNLGVKIFDETGDLEVGTVDGLSGVAVKGADTDDIIEIVTVGALTINESVSSDGMADVFLAARGSAEGNDIELNAAVVKSGLTGNVQLVAGDDLMLTNNGSIVAENASQVSLLAGVDIQGPDRSSVFVTGNSQASIVMAEDSLIATDEGDIELRATGDVAISTVNANFDGDTSLGNVLITADQNGLTDFIADGVGEIREVTTSESENIIADELTLFAATGIGSQDDLNLDVNTVSATNTTGGNIQLLEMSIAGDNALDVQAVSNQAGNIDIRTEDGDLNINGDVSTTGSGTVTLIAGDSDLDGNGDLNVSASITTESGSVTLTSAGNDVRFTADGDVTTTSGRIDVSSGETDDLGEIHQASGSVLDAGNAEISLTANGQVTLGQIVTDSTSDQAVTIHTDAGVESVDPGNLLNIDAAQGRLVINSVSGVGPIQTTIDSLDLTNLSDGNVTITETDALDVIRVEQLAPGGIDLSAGGTLTLVQGEHGVSGTSEAVNLSTTGAGSEIVIDSTLQSTTGVITVNAAGNVRMGAQGLIQTDAAELLVVAGDVLNTNSTTTGGILMEDGALITAPLARVDLVADGDIQVGRIVANGRGNEVRITSTAGAILDAGDASGVDIETTTLGLSAANGIGDGNSLETSVEFIAIENSTSGGIEVTNSTGDLLTVTDFGSTALDATLGALSGIQLQGNTPEMISLQHDGELLIDSSVMNQSGGGINLSSGDTSRLTVGARIVADITSEQGIVTLTAGADLVVLDTNPGNSTEADIEGFKVSGTAGAAVPVIDRGTDQDEYDPNNPDIFNPPTVENPDNFDPDDPADLDLLPVRFAPGVLVKSSTGAITQPVPSLSNIATPQVLATGISTITGDFGRDLENSFTYQIDWDSVFGTDLDTRQSGDPLFSVEEQRIVGIVPGDGPGSFDFDHIFFANPDPNNPAAPILITLTLVDDGNISFFGNGGAVDLGAVTMSSLATVPGEGLAGGLVFDLSIETPTLEPPRTQITESFKTIEAGFEAELFDEEFEGVLETEVSRDDLILIIQKISADGTVERDRFGRPIQRTLYGADAIERLSDLPELHERLDSGHWKIYSKEGEDGQMMLVEDVILRDGKPVVGEEGTQDRPPTSESPMTTPPPEKAGALNQFELEPNFDNGETPEPQAISRLEDSSMIPATALAFLPGSSKVIRRALGRVLKLRHLLGILIGVIR